MKKKIQDIAPLLAEHFIDIENDVRIENEYLELIKNNSKRLELYYKYLHRLHDSQILEAKLTENRFVLVVNDITMTVFAESLICKKTLIIDNRKLIFPLHFDFDIIDLTYNIVDELGFIHQIKPVSIDEYLYEQVLAVDNDRIVLGLVVWSKALRESILILLSAKNCIVTEYQRKEWNGIFTPIYNTYLDYFKLEFENGLYLADYKICEALIDECDSRVGD